MTSPRRRVRLRARAIFIAAILGLALCSATTVQHVAADELRALHTELLVPRTTAPPSDHPRGQWLRIERGVTFPAPPPGASLWLAGSGDGLAPLECDDVLSAAISDPRGVTLVTWEHDFGDGRATHPYGPVRLVAAPPEGPVSVVVTLDDTRPPLTGCQPVYLTLMAPPPATAPAATSGATVTPTPIAIPTTGASAAPTAPVASATAVAASVPAGPGWMTGALSLGAIDTGGDARVGGAPGLVAQVGRALAAIRAHRLALALVGFGIGVASFASRRIVNAVFLFVLHAIRFALGRRLPPLPPA